MVIRVIGTEEQTAAFKHLWAKYVSSFRESVHCARCLVGPYSRLVRPAMKPGEYTLDTPSGEWEYFYLCGVAKSANSSPDTWHRNLHLAVRRAPGKLATVTAFNGAIFEISDFAAIPIQPLPLGFRGMSAEFTACRNWQFGVQQYNPADEKGTHEEAERLTSIEA